MGEWFHDTAASGSLALAMPVALVAGLVSFFSPCVIPLLPGYLSYATGLSGADLASGAAGERRGRMLLGSVLFVLGFSVVFVAIGSLSGALGAWLVTWRDTLTVVLGVLTILLGLVFAGVFNRLLPGLQRDWRVHSVPAVGLAAAPLLGFLFGLGWTPCLGPTLSAVNSLAFTEANPGRGAFLGVAYCLGLGVPFVLVALGARWAVGATSFLRTHARTVTRVGGVVLIGVGLMLVTGAWSELMQWLRGWLATTGLGEGAPL
jgi:cytochrome c-type biogenesis protein